jgi:hypothetical protein
MIALMANVRFAAFQALQDFEPNAKLAVPALVEFLNTGDYPTSLRPYATKVLKAIDPAAAAQAGVK